jgi:hypothetical protein
VSKYYSKSDAKFQHKSFIPLFRSDHELCKQGMPWKRRLGLSHLAFKTAHGDGDTLAGLARATGLDRRTAVKTLIADLHRLELVKPSDETLVVATVACPTQFTKVFCMTPACPLTPLENLILWKLVDLERTDPDYVWDGHRVRTLGKMIGERYRMSIHRCTERLEKKHKLIDKDWAVQHDAIPADWYADGRRNKIRDARTDKLVEKLTSAPGPPPPLDTSTRSDMAKFMDFIHEQIPAHISGLLMPAINRHVNSSNAAQKRACLVRLHNSAYGTALDYEDYRDALSNGEC